MIPDSELRAQLLRVLEGTASRADRDAIETWRNSEPGSEKAYRDFESIWKASAHLLEPDSEVIATIVPRPTAAELLREVTEPERPSPLIRGAKTRDTRALRRVRQTIAASFTLLVVGSAAWFFGRSAGLEAMAVAEMTTGAEDLATIHLVDGTTVRLAPNSRLSVLPDHPRGVALEGEAFFAVARRAGPSFVVRTGSGEAEVFGTRFNVNAKGQAAQITVVEGVVDVIGGGGRVRVRDGELSSIVRGRHPSPPVLADLDSTLDWMGSALVFEATPMDRVAADLERIFQVDVVIRSPAVAGRTVSGVFEDGEFPTVSAAICRVVGARCAWSDERLIIEER